jgi:hypothetical protein
MVALVTVLPVPGGPWMRLSGCCSTLRTACSWLWLSSGRLGALKLALGSGMRSVMGSTCVLCSFTNVQNPERRRHVSEYQ